MDPFIAEIKMFAGNFAPRGYAFCNGQLLPIAQNSALFAVIGTTYGGDGVTNFALPNLQGRIPMHAGTGAGLSSRHLGEQGGEENVTLNAAQLPAHNHSLSGFNGPGNQSTVSGNSLSNDGGNQSATYNSTSPNAPMAANSIGMAGGNQPHTNLQPFLCVNFIIALQGIFPSRN
ncbi:MAG: phage tail protein [Methylomicrobium sp.]|nr:phage tail protein [Methylomicrobium sp.]